MHSESEKRSDEITGEIRPPGLVLTVPPFLFATKALEIKDTHSQCRTEFTDNSNEALHTKSIVGRPPKCGRPSGSLRDRMDAFVSKEKSLAFIDKKV